MATEDDGWCHSSTNLAYILYRGRLENCVIEVAAHGEEVIDDKVRTIE